MRVVAVGLSAVVTLVGEETEIWEAAREMSVEVKSWEMEASVEAVASLLAAIETLFAVLIINLFLVWI